jgi:type IV pilus assembly protein PilN
MAHINLLPWREARRKEQQKEFLIFLFFGAAVAVVLVFFAHIQVNGMIDYQTARNQYLQNEIKILDKRIAEIRELEKTKAALLERMRIIEELQASRPGVVHLFDELVTSLPEGLYITSVTQKGNILTIEGEAESNARVSAYMRRLDASPWLTDSKLSIIKSNKKKDEATQTKEFKLTVTQTSPKAETEKKGG